MGLPLHLSIKLGTHLMKMKLRGVEKFPMIVEVEPLFACNLKCVGCGKSVSKEGVFDQAVAAIKQAKAAGFQVYTNSTFFNTDSPQTVIDVLNYLNNELKVDRLEI